LYIVYQNIISLQRGENSVLWFRFFLRLISLTKTHPETILDTPKAKRLVYVFFGPMKLPSGDTIQVRVDSHTATIDPEELYEYVFDITDSNNRDVKPIDVPGERLNEVIFSHSRDYLQD
jgi:hypothetical protein